jgi:hypothetical protein
MYVNLPDKPYCSNDLSRGLKIRSKAIAFERFAYIQINKYYAVAYLTFDVDVGAGALAWEYAGLPPPTFITVNPENNHAHLVYELLVPVLLWENARPKPIAWLNAIRRAYVEALLADAGYNGLITKNPNDERWYVLDFGDQYDLEELSEAAKLQDRHFQPPTGFREDFASEGRNNFLFEVGRFYSYRKKEYVSGKPELYIAVHAHIEKVNITEFPTPLPANEIRHLAKSITNFTWKNRDTITGGYKRKTTDVELKKIRSVNAYNTHEIRKAATEAKITKAIDKLLRKGRKTTKAAIAREAGITRRTLDKHQHLLPKKCILCNLPSDRSPR